MERSFSPSVSAALGENLGSLRGRPHSNLAKPAVFDPIFKTTFPFPLNISNGSPYQAVMNLGTILGVFLEPTRSSLHRGFSRLTWTVPPAWTCLRTESVARSDSHELGGPRIQEIGPRYLGVLGKARALYCASS